METKPAPDAPGGAELPRMLLLAEPGPAREAYLRALAGAGARCTVADNLGEMQERLRREPHCGLLVDVPTLIKSSGPEKRLVHGILEHYPVLRLRYDQPSGVIHGLFYGQAETGGDVVADFVAISATTFAPRSMRGEERENVILNVLIHRSRPEGEEGGERAVTVNASIGGCFLYTCGDFAVGDAVWLDFLELADRAPIPARLRWRVEWGKSMVLPGIGVAFESMTRAQMRELSARLGFGGGCSQLSRGCGP